MGAHVHKLTDKNFEARTAVCAVDGPVAIKLYGNTYSCEVAYRAYKARVKRDRIGHQALDWKDLKTDTCAHCGFVALDPCQMDLDHINGDRHDHRPENAQTLCANCHRLKSYRPALFAPA